MTNLVRGTKARLRNIGRLPSKDKSQERNSGLEYNLIKNVSN